MADMGLIGANNPIFQASQQINQQSAQQKNAAVEGIVNQTMQKQSKQLAAQLDMWSKLATESKDPTLRKMAFQKLGGLLNVNFNMDANLDEMATALTDVRKVMIDKTGTYLPDVQQEIVDNFTSRYGTEYISKEESEAFQKKQEQGYLTQGLAAGRQMEATPELAGSPEAMAYAQAEKDRLLAAGGTKGQEIAGRKPEEDAITAGIREFEMVNGIPATMRGTSQYKKAYEDWLKIKSPAMGASNVVIVPTAEGFAAVNKQTKTVTPLGINKPLTGEMITTEQQIGTVKDVFERIKTDYKPGYTGAIQGRIGSLKSVTTGNTPEQAAFISNLQDLNNTLVYLKSGKQINEQEYERLKKAMPHLNLADTDFRARMNEFEKTLNSIITERQKKMGGYGKQTQVTETKKSDPLGLR